MSVIGRGGSFRKEGRYRKEDEDLEKELEKHYQPRKL